MAPELVTEALRAKLKSAGWSLSVAKRRPGKEGVPKGAHGVTIPPRGLVWIEKREPALMAATLLHESAHVISLPLIMRMPDMNRAHAEVIAETAAMLAGEKLGVQDPESDDYINGWLDDANPDDEMLSKLAEISSLVAAELVRVVVEVQS